MKTVTMTITFEIDELDLDLIPALTEQIELSTDQLVMNLTVTTAVQ